MLDPISYTYEADHHCPACAIARFGTAEHGIGADRWPSEDARDDEGNPIGAVAPWDEWWEPSEIRVQVLTCSDCAAASSRTLGTVRPFADAGMSNHKHIHPVIRWPVRLLVRAFWTLVLVFILYVVLRGR